MQPNIFPPASIPNPSKGRQWRFEWEEAEAQGEEKPLVLKRRQAESFVQFHTRRLCIREWQGRRICAGRRASPSTSSNGFLDVKLVMASRAWS